MGEIEGFYSCLMGCEERRTRRHYLGNYKEFNIVVRLREGDGILYKEDLLNCGKG